MGYQLSQRIVWGVEVDAKTAVAAGINDFDGPKLPKGVAMEYMYVPNSKPRYVIYVVSRTLFDTKPDVVHTPILRMRDLVTTEGERQLLRDAMRDLGLDKAPDWMILTGIV